MTPPTRPLRLLPAKVAVALLFALLLIQTLLPRYAMIGLLGAIATGLAVLIWWLAFSRAPHLERWIVLLVILAFAAAIRLTPGILHHSITGGMMGRLFYVFAIPVFALALAAYALTSRSRVALVACGLAACAAFALVRTDGVYGEGRSQFAFRWTPTREQRLLAASTADPVAPPAAAPKPVETPLEAAPKTPTSAPAPPPKTTPRPAAEWPGFRGPNRDSVVAGVRIGQDWTAAPPVQIWRRPVGPAWSSFAVGNGLLYTQEQRGEHEVVACYRAATGEPVWTHRDSARFYESNAGAGPRATPELRDGRVYTLGATGIVNALDAATGAVVWTRDAAGDTGAQNPGWGFSGSPLVVDGLVIVAASGRLAAYDRATGEPRWKLQEGGNAYTSPHLLTIDGVPQIVLQHGPGATAFSPADGRVLWRHAWPGVAILQPGVAPDGGLLLSTSDMMGAIGTRKVAVARSSDGWKVEEAWTTRNLKPYFNDFVVHKGHVYGFDGSILACIDVKDAQRKWKGGRYGNGQFLLLRDQDLLLVLSEEGDLALVSATPERFQEFAKFKALDDKSWNHPVVVGNTLFVRNASEMAAFRLPAGGT
jgi:outer membrane protein assembly factor BamB